MEEEIKQQKNKPRCPDCGSGYGYVKQDGCFVCRQCGEITQLSKEDGN